MEYTIENAFLKLTVNTLGAQAVSLIRKSDGVEHMWEADPGLWGYHAPILFPHTGGLPGGKLEAKGKVYQSPQHGFARTQEHTLVKKTGDTLVLELTDNEQTLQCWPYHFRLTSVFTLDGDTVHHTLSVENNDEEPMPFGIGFHPAFAVPFDKNHKATDYELRFSRKESPIVMNTLPKGLITGDSKYIWKNQQSIPLDEHLFDNDSYCMTGLHSETLGLYEKDSQRAVVCWIENFPHTLIWSKPGMPRFVCIEPWESLPSPDDGDIKWENKPAAAVLEPGENWSTTLSTSFLR